MAEEMLYRPLIETGHREVGGKSMTEIMKTEIRDADLLTNSPERYRDHVRVDIGKEEIRMLMTRDLLQHIE